MSDTRSRSAAEANLKAATLAGILADDETSALYAVGVGIGFALLDVADAIREQTAELGGGLEELKKSADWAAEHRR